MKRTLISLAIFLVFPVWKTSSLYAQTEYITVHANQAMDTNIAFMQGFINGGTEYNIELTQKLKPAFWGFGWDVATDYTYTAPNFSLTKMASIYSAYMNYFGIGDPLLLQPWTGGWVQWDTFVNGMINQSISTNRPVEFWSVFGEPDATFSGTPGQYIEMFRRTDSIIKTVDPLAKMVGPDFIDFGILELLFVIDSLDAVGVHPEAISWHEFGDYPENIYLHVQQMRDSLAVRPLSGTPQIHIQEYGDPSNRLIPGWSAGWLYYFERSNINWASHACFNEFDGINTWDDCWNGLSGMYMSDGNTPQPNYWLHRAYADLYRPGRLVTSSAQPRTIALASKQNGNQEMRIIAARYYSIQQGTPDPPANVEVKIRNYPYGNNSIQPILIQRIPAQTVAYSTLLSNPVTVLSSTIQFISDSATVIVPSFVDGDVYVIYINPDMTNILSAENISNDVNGSEDLVTIYPNPARGELTIGSLEGVEAVSIVNAQGAVVYESVVQANLVKVDLTLFPAGLYSVNLRSKEKMVSRKLLIE
jgi:hypothetical protein